MQQALKNHPYIESIRQLNLQINDRLAFHKAVEPILIEMGKDNVFLSLVAETNFYDKSFLQQKWSLYNIPCLYVYEDEDMYLKIHFFPSMQQYKSGTAAHCIHHHNNYILTTAAIFGSGYETMLFDKHIKMDETTLETKLAVSKHFTQAQAQVHTIDAWEPHIVYQPQSFSATLQLWSPDKKRATDKLRHLGLIKAIKMPLRRLIYWLKLENQLGISAQKTYQFYPEGNHFKAIEEDIYFEPTRKATGKEVEYYSMQTICYFLQERQLLSKSFISKLISSNQIPSHYLPLFNALLNEENIEQTYCKASINIPQGNYTLNDVLAAAK